MIWMILGFISVVLAFTSYQLLSMLAMLDDDNQ